MARNYEALSEARYEPGLPPSSFRLTELHPGETRPLSYHEQMEVKLFLSDGAEVECEGISYIAQAGDVFLFNPNERHAIQWLHGTPRYRILMLSPAMLLGKDSSFLETAYLRPYVEGQVFFRNQIRNNAAIREDVSRLCEEMEHKRPGYELMVQGLMYQLFAHLFRDEVARTVVPGEVEALRRRQKQFAPIYEYISRNYQRPLCLRELACVCHLSENRFCVLFRELTGTTPVQYINRYRVGKARVLLKTTNLSVTQISETCGFSEPGYFSRCYRKYTGYPPTEERRRSDAQTIEAENGKE